MDSTTAPPFYQIDEYKFQCVCRDLLERQIDDRVKSCSIFGERGQKQYGIDLIAPLGGSYANDVAQCKRFAKISPHEIVAASDEFLKHLDYWNPYHLRRFILIVACAMDRRQQQEELHRQRLRFAEIGIEYEWWDARGLRQRLAPHPDIVRLYFPVPHEHWVESICGRQPQPIAGVSSSASTYPLTQNIIESQLEQFAVAFSQDVAQEIDEVRELHRRGNTPEAQRRVDELQQSNKWALLQPTVKAKALRFAVSLELSLTRDTKRARALVEQARQLDPVADDTVARTLLRYYEDGAEGALAEVVSPRTIDAVNLKAALTLEQGNPQEALCIAKDLPEGLTPDAETYRVQALALLGTGDLTAARDVTQQAVAIKPLWESTKTTEAIIIYYDTISPAAHPAHFLVMPEAVGWSFLKRDDVSLSALRKAESHFCDLVTKYSQEPTRDDRHRSEFEVWRLACLANDPERQPQAADLCQQMLDVNPANHWALAWAVNRNFNVDLSAGEIALDHELGKPSTGVSTVSDVRFEKVIILAGLYLRGGKFSKARQLLQREQTELKRLGFEPLVSLWWGQLYALESNTKKALDVARSASHVEVRRKIKSVALREQYQRTRKWKPLTRHLEKSLRRTGDGVYLLELCQLKAARNNWQFVAAQAENLVRSVATAEAVRIAATGMAYAGYSARCLELLEANKHFFPGETLPNELLRLRVHCQKRVGSLSQALADAEELVAQDDTVENFLALMDVQLQKADLKGLAVTARRIIGRDDFSARDTLRAAKLVHLEDAALAANLWRQAKMRALDEPSLVAEAMNLGYTLGLDKELGQLRERMYELAARGDGNVQSFTLREVVTHQEERSRRLDEVFNNYTQGTIPLHLFTKEARASMAEWLHGFSAQNRASVDLRRHPAIYTRHGGSSVKRDVLSPDSPVRLHLDVSALLLAAELDILDVVEEQFKPLRISNAMTYALLEQLDRLKPGQPSQFETNRRIVEKVEANKLQIVPEGSELPSDADARLVSELGEFWVTIATRAISESAYVVDHLPLRNRNDEKKAVSLPPEFQHYVINSRSVADGLHTHGPLSDAKHQEALAALGVEAKTKLDAPPPPSGARLYLLGASASVLEGAELLDYVCDHFRVFVTASAVQLARAGVQEHTHRLRMVSWLQLLVDRLRRGIDDGTYQIIPVEEERTPTPLEREQSSNYDLHTFTDLLHFKAEEGDVLWVDDRFVNGYGQRDGAPIIGIVDVLRTLLAANKLLQVDYYAKLLHLRRSNVRYLPLDADEILFHLKQAQINEQYLVETEELATLRRYAAACLLDGDNLQKSPQPEGSANTLGEINFILETMGAVFDAIAASWVDETVPLETAVARADWLLLNLYTGRFGCRHLFSGAADDDDLYIIGSDIGEAFVRGVGIGERVVKLEPEDGTANGNPAERTATDPDLRSRRENYFDWVKARLMTPRGKADPNSLASAARTVREVFEFYAAQGYSDVTERRQAQRLVQRLFLDLPEEMRTEVALAPKVLAWIGINIVSAVQVGALTFQQEEFWRAAEAAVGGSQVSINSLRDSSSYVFVRYNPSSSVTGNDTCSGVTTVGNGTKGIAEGRGGDTTNVLIEVRDEAGRVVGNIKNSGFGVLQADKNARSRVLLKNLHWFDTDHEQARKEIEEIVSLDDAHARVERVNELSKTSAAEFYFILDRKMREQHRIDPGELMTIDSGGLLRHHRLRASYPDGVDFAQVMATASAELLADEGIAMTLDRVGCLPIRISERITGALKNLPRAERCNILTEFASQHPSPIGKLHFVDLCLRVAGDSEELGQAEDVLIELFDETQGALQFGLFKAILSFVNDELGYRSEIAVLSPNVRLAAIWAHSVKIYDLVHTIFAKNLNELKSLTSWFQSASSQFSIETLYHDSRTRHDCAHPTNLRRIEFLATGSLALLGENDRDRLDRVKLLSLVRQVGFVESEGRMLPRQELFGDTTLMTNITDSFLTGDKADLFTLIIGEDDVQILVSENLRAIVRRNIQELGESSHEAQSWSLIASIVKSYPMYREIEDDFKRLLAGIDFDNLLRKDRLAANNALKVASVQSRLLSDADRTRCEDWLLKYLKDYSDRCSDIKNRNDSDELANCINEGNDLIEVALLLSVRPDDPRASGQALSSLVQRMHDVWSEIHRHVEATIQKFVFDLPVHQLHGMWLVVLALRASRRLA